MKKLRGKKSLRYAAKKAGISHTYLNVVEKGYDLRSGSPVKATPDTLRALSVAYSHPYEDLMKRAGYIEENEKESEYSLPEEVILNVIKEAEKEYNVNLRDDPLVESAVRDLIHNLAKMKQGFQKKD